jgi:anaerobic selenocysteine-containing dehydrogenase
MNDVPSICRFCPSFCSVVATVEDGRLVSVIGDKDGPLHQGFSCVKGRALPAMLNHPDRVLRPQMRRGDGWASIGSTQAMDDIAERLSSIVERHGPRSVWIYLGTQGFNGTPINWPLIRGFASALGTPWFSTTITIDQPGKGTAAALHGSWMAPPYRTDNEVMLIVGANPLISQAGPAGKSLVHAVRRGMKLIVIDPRRSDVARRAFLHLQPRPGEDVAILAALLKVILEEELNDQDFVDEHVAGIAELKAALSGFDLDDVAARADVDVADLLLAARTLASSRRGWTWAGTGGSMSQSSTVVEYLILCIRTVCGYWPRAGERVNNPGTLVPARPARAQARGPVPAYNVGEPMRVHGLGTSVWGPPTAAAPDEILLDGEGQVRALISVGGNPVATWPDQLKTAKALRSLELLVQIDPWMTQTSKLAHYVIPPTMNFEAPMTTQAMFDQLPVPASPAFGQYSPAVVEPPPGSDVMEEWEFFYGLAERMGLLDDLGKRIGLPPAFAPIPLDAAIPEFGYDLSVKPTSDQLLEFLSRDSRVPLEEVKRHPHGQLFPDPPAFIEPRDPNWSGRLDVGNADMMADLRTAQTAGKEDGEYTYRLLCRRVMETNNSSGNFPETNRGRPYNPALMHPLDMERLGLVKQDIIEIRSPHAAVVAVVEPDDSVRPGCISMTHGRGDLPELDDQVMRIGTPPSRLLSFDLGFDRYSGQPLMSNIPVAIRRREALSDQQTRV